ncbi:hypothetical protein A2631_05640 [Candidatus Daviesbacteria bacterium RIFCSPHIGHO2_01_FULL_44_29]|nr:MAG: hypothetical protein A2631_05640 [Candidatus Daviesbacteria bacterium RIFCSPHIGHO2_01_FULL_44_29]OGE39696.1 MAG: hypothetical protein A3E86_00150 [Candidatus Daviesbacteria bacterium RIFCSPHIGHO2_12_FULL_47_45]OGE69839.1 MAG: hypothetical protein A3B55_05515 [Candidatus Daviesbacteria bacterium RIFCSPLOWO2_01_FULL_43_15]
MRNTITLPGLIDPHVHLREPGATQKEDFESGTKAAIAGGITVVLDMPNNPEPTIMPENLEKKIKLATGRVWSDIGFHFAATPGASLHFEEVSKQVFAMKLYMNHTTGPVLIDNRVDQERCFAALPDNKIMMVHAEGDTLEVAIELAKKYHKKLYVAHVNFASQMEMIKQAKNDGLEIYCEVTPHHLFLTEEDAERLGPYAIMRPPLVTKADQIALWAGIEDGTVDTIGSDHAPHTKEEKESSEKTPFGVPNLDTTLLLLLNAVSEGRLEIEDIKRLCFDNPQRIFTVPKQTETFVEVDLDGETTISNDKLYTKCGWSPYDGWEIKGKINRVVLRGETIVEDGKVLGSPKGQIIFPTTLNERA